MGNYIEVRGVISLDRDSVLRNLIEKHTGEDCYCVESYIDDIRYERGPIEEICKYIDDANNNVDGLCYFDEEEIRKMIEDVEGGDEIFSDTLKNISTFLNNTKEGELCRYITIN